jgi:thiol:disulfide interchange protein
MRTLLAVLTLALLASPAAAQPPDDLPFKLPGFGPKATSFYDIADYEAAIEPAQAKPGETVTFKLTVTPKLGAWTYPANPPDGQLARSEIDFPRRGDLIFVGGVADPPGWQTKPSAEAGKTDRYYPEAVTWELKAVVSPKATPGVKKVALTGTRIQACNEANCFYTDLRNPPSAEIEVLAGPAVPVDPKYADEVRAALETVAPAKMATPMFGPEGAKPPAPAPRDAAAQPDRADHAPHPAAAPHAGIVRKAPASLEEHEAGLNALREKIDQTPVVVQGGLAGLLMAAVFWGLVSLVTPCVFPMIPITVSLFLKQSHQSTAGVIKLALVYCLTIIAVLGASAIFLLSLFRGLSVDPYMNIFIGALFIFFALSLFGLYDIALPGFLLRATERRRGAGGTVGTIFGALAFSIVSFTCVAPFLGGFAGLTGSQQYSNAEIILAGIAFATAFASPFFLLAVFPSLLKKLPKSGGWLDSVKVVMGFLELAAAFKFFRTAELRLLDRPEYFTYDLVLGSWVAIAVATGLYLLGVFRLPHDEERPNVGVVRMLFGLAFLTLAVYLTPALFRGGPSGHPNRPAGVIYAWVDAFLLPEPVAAGGEGLPWSADLKGAVDRIAREKRSTGAADRPLIFVDFTGVTCTNCKYNEENIFTRPEVHELLRQYTLVQMYTDDVPVDFYTIPPDRIDRKLEAAANLDFQRAVFGTEQLPLYVILEPQAAGPVKVVGVYDEGKINDVARFTEFLKQPLDGR